MLESNFSPRWFFVSESLTSGVPRRGGRGTSADRSVAEGDLWLWSCRWGERLVLLSGGGGVVRVAFRCCCLFGDVAAIVVTVDVIQYVWVHNRVYINFILLLTKRRCIIVESAWVNSLYQVSLSSPQLSDYNSCYDLYVSYCTIQSHSIGTRHTKSNISDWFSLLL